MIYTNEARAREIAAMLNERKGYFPVYAVLSRHGWTVVESGIGEADAVARGART